jgi:hypothetical protein
MCIIFMTPRDSEMYKYDDGALFCVLIGVCEITEVPGDDRSYDSNRVEFVAEI